TLGDSWESYSDEEKDFCRELWGQRVISAGATYRWFLKQIFRLWINPVRLARTTKGGVIIAWPLYVLLTLFAVPLLTIVYFRKSEVMRDYLNDIRLYIDPRGRIERSIVKKVDESLRQDILKLVGLSSDFRPLKPGEQMPVLGQKQHFERIIWVSHSLGTVISYNVLSDLLHEAVSMEESGDEQQKEGVDYLRNRLTRFVTLGSPLDKIAVLFDTGVLRPLPVQTRKDFFKNADDITVGYFWEEKDWWINFYHVLDPVSGALNNKLICSGKTPANLHTRSCIIPGVAHTSYWKDRATLRFILSRAYGRKRLPDKALVRWPTSLLTLLAAGSYVVWAVIMIAGIAIMLTWGWQFLLSTYARFTGMFGI
ncbi:MAG: hypothetical protein NTW07_05905, partial [candidate division Zixibacteria bacterium]|nr:hypothetical protein [candidate division Zixibacteria bacterium]